MPRSGNQKQKLAVLRSILLEYTSKNHPMTMKEIIAELKSRGISAERKSIYNDIETLIMLGTDVKTARGRTVGYYIDKREFEISELKLLVDAVSSSKFIPESQSKQLIKKLTSLTDVHDRPSLNRSVFVSDRVSEVDSDVLDTVDKIHIAIESDRDIAFSYFQWTPEKKKELRRNGERYRVSPWALVWDDNNYYLVGYDLTYSEMRHYRVDKMIRAGITDFKRSGEEEFKKFNISSYSKSVFGMFGGEPMRITLSCANRLANTMLDRFGSDTVILKDGDRFRITVNIVPSPVFFGWVLSFGGDVKILSPESVVNDLESLADAFR